MKRAAIIITDAPGVYWDGGPFFAEMCGQTVTSEQLLADLAWVLAAAEKAVERAREAGDDTAAALLGGCVARVHAALEVPS